MHQLAAVLLAVATLIVAAGVASVVRDPAATPTVEECFAANGITGVTVWPDGSVDVPAFTTADNNAGQAWDAHTTAIYDRCMP